MKRRIISRQQEALVAVPCKKKTGKQAVLFAGDCRPLYKKAPLVCIEANIPQTHADAHTVCSSVTSEQMAYALLLL